MDTTPSSAPQPLLLQQYRQTTGRATSLTVR
eukprot:CAMPEP_0185155696 /NCGR_PEP_ID=MMETSP1139-20130426/611_1 /TAXON_ID=298111 /ORGANISM="Pavlova sp., Strain CCMP459" /LENGTH=30 /DNA_ID= /DNA_START= /DNA_END= /DNA_ORIENTATION=